MQAHHSPRASSLHLRRRDKPGTSLSVQCVTEWSLLSCPSSSRGGQLDNHATCQARRQRENSTLAVGGFDSARAKKHGFSKFLKSQAGQSASRTDYMSNLSCPPILMMKNLQQPIGPQVVFFFWIENSARNPCNQLQHGQLNCPDSTDSCRDRGNSFDTDTCLASPA